MMDGNMATLQDKKDNLFDSAWDDKHTQDYVYQWGELSLHKKIPELCNLLLSEIVLESLVY